MRKTITLLIALLALSVSSWATPTTITWDAENGLTSIGLNEYTNLFWNETYHSYNNGAKTAMIEGVKVTISATVDGSDASFSTYENSTDLSVSNGATLTFSSALYLIHSIVINFDGNNGYLNSPSTWNWDGESEQHTLSWTGSATHSVTLTDASVSHITSIVFTVEAIPTTTVTWNSENGLTDINLSEYTNNCYNNNCYSYNDGPKTRTIDGVTITISATEDGSSANFDTYQGNTSLNVYNGGTITFSSASSQFLSIVVNFGETEDGYVNEPSDWEFNASQRTVTWSGNATNSIVLESAYIEKITSIVFTLKAEEEPDPDVPTHLVSTVIWETADLATVNVEMGYNSTGQSQNIKNIIVTNNAVYTAGQYCHFNTSNGQLNDSDWPDFSMSNGGSLTFAPAEGKLTKIVITCDDIYPSNLAAGSGWVWDGSSKLTWSDENGATSVVLAGDGSSTSFSSGPIRRIEFTLAADPDAQGDVKWDKSELEYENVSLLVYNGIVSGLNQTIEGIVATVTAPEYGDYCHFLYDSQNDKVSISISGNGTLTFAPETGRLTRIVIAGIVDSDNTNLPDESGWTRTANKLIWSGAPSFSVDLANASIDYITYVAFTIDDSDPNDTREVPELKFLNGSDELTEATIVRDCHDDIFEPGTYYLPSTEYFLYVNNGVKYYQGQPFIDWATPTAKGLTMTYSVPNNDVITLTKTSGNSFEFTVNGIGDAVVTAHTEGNEDYKPASTTFTIHVEEGKAATKECVLKFIGGPNAGQFVPEDYKFEMETGEEFPWSWFGLREKDYPDYVYAPSFTIWGSRNYYVACLNAETKLRALTAGDDMFTIRYARCEGGDMNNEYRLIEFPVHIKPTEIALTTSVDFASDPSSNSSIANNATYDPTTQQVQIGQVISDEMVQAALDCYAFGHPGWNENLRNTISFELPQGTGSFKINGSIQAGCLLKVKIRGEAGVHSFTPAQVAAGEATVHYNVPNQTAVVIYINSTGGGSPAPKRAPAAKKDAPLAALSGIDMSPVYAITSKPDPDNSSVYYSTHFNETQKYRLPAGTDAYVATISGENMNLTKVVDGGQVLPANTAVILRSTSASVTLTPTDDAAVEVSAANQLRGTDSEMAAPANCYVLSGKSADNSVTGVGFYQFSGTLAAHKAYLINSGGPGLAPQHRMRFIFNGENAATGIENTSASFGGSEKRLENGQLIIIKNGVRYNAQGQIVK